MLRTSNRNIQYKLNHNLYLITATGDIYMINQPKQELPPLHVQGLYRDNANTSHEDSAQDIEPMSQTHLDN